MTLKVPIFPELPVSFEAESWSDRLTNDTTGQRRRRKHTRRGRWSDEWFELGRPLTSSSSGWPTNASLPSKWRPRPPGSEGGVLNSSRGGGREGVVWQGWRRQTEKGKREGEVKKQKVRKVDKKEYPHQKLLKCQKCSADSLCWV